MEHVSEVVLRLRPLWGALQPPRTPQQHPRRHGMLVADLACWLLGFLWLRTPPLSGSFPSLPGKGPPGRGDFQGQGTRETKGQQPPEGATEGGTRLKFRSVDPHREIGSLRALPTTHTQPSISRGPWVHFSEMGAFWAELAPNDKRAQHFTALLDDVRRLSPSLATQTVDTDDVAQPCAVVRTHSPRGWGSHVIIDTLSAVSVGIMFLCVFVGRSRVLLCQTPT